MGLVLLGIIGLAVYLWTHPNQTNNTTTKTQSSSPSSPKLPNPHPPQEVLAVVNAYIQARENAVGADQTTPTAWIAKVQQITTTSWFTELQPKGDSSTAGGLADYYLAHRNGYIVKTRLSQCIWDFKIALPTANNGVVYCELNDTTVSQATGAVISASSLPFGWSHTGRQIPLTLKLVKQNHSWLVNEDISGGD